MFKYIRLFFKLITLNNVTDKESCRQWLLSLLPTLKKLALQNSVTIDDKLLSYVETIVNSTELFGYFYDLIASLIATDDPVFADFKMDRVKEIAAMPEVCAAMSLPTILLIIQYVMDAIAAIKRLVKSDDEEGAKA